jgi:hypothetical protein
MNVSSEGTIEASIPITCGTTLGAPGVDKLARAKAKSQSRKRFVRVKAPPPALTSRTPSIRKGTGTGLMLMVPVETLRLLRMRAAETGTTVRALVLDALRKSGYPVPPDELVDRRRRHGAT